MSVSRPRRPRSGAWIRRAGGVLAALGLSYGLYLLGGRLGLFEAGPMVGEPGAAHGGGANDGGGPEPAPRVPDTPPAPEGPSAPAPREALVVEGETFPATEMPADPRARFFRLARQTAPGELHLKGRELVDALLAPGWTYVRYRDAATRDALLAATFTLRAEPMPGEPEAVAVPLMNLLQAFQAGKFRVRPKGPVFEVMTSGVR